MASYNIHIHELGYSEDELTEVFSLPADVLTYFFHPERNRIRILKHAQ
jgi:hypothetical protein